MNNFQNGHQLTLPINGIESPKKIIKRIRNYLVGQVIGVTRDESLLEEVLKCTYCRVFIEREGLRQSGIDNVETIPSLYRQTFTKIKKTFPLLFERNDEILLDSTQISFIDSELAKIRLTENDHDIIGDIYEAFIGASYKGQAGQFFTPLVAIQTVVELTEPRSSDQIIDPACGSGGFLLGATRYIAKSHRVQTNNFHGIDKDKYLVRLSQLHLAIKFDTTFPIYCADSLLWEGDDFDDSQTKSLIGNYDLVLANPPFGSKIIALADDDRHNFELAYKWRRSKKTGEYEQTTQLAKSTPPQILFIERCISLLKKGGRAGLVVPESLLSSKTHRYTVQYILAHTTPTAVIGMPEELFKISGKGGTHTKVCLLILEKRETPPDHEIFMAEAKWCGHDSRAREIPKNDLPVIVENYKKFKEGLLNQPTLLGFSVPYKDVRSLVLAPRFYDPEPKLMMARLKQTHDFIKLGDLIDKGLITISTGDEVGRLAYGTGDIPFVRTSDISNWEIKVSPKHKVSEQVYEKYKSKQDIQAGDILMVRDGTYLIGTCAMVSEYDTKIVYQSHLYKIRVLPSAPFDNHLLLAMLSSPFVDAQIKSLTFTQDIINSLGSRIQDIMLPLPKSEKKKQEVSEVVRKALKSRIEARELTRKARLAVVNA